MSNKRKLKPQVKVILIVLGIILGSIILENLIEGISSFIKNKKSQIEYDKKEEILQQTPEYKKGEEITEFVNEMILYLSNGNYEAIYNQTDPDYLESLNIDSSEKLKPIIEEHFGGIPKNAKLETYSKISGRYVCEISIEKDDLIEMVDIIVTPRGSDNFYIIIDSIRSIEKYNKQYRFATSEFEYDVKYKVKRADEEILVIEAQNKTSKNLVSSLVSTVLVKSNHAECSVKNVNELENIEFPAGTTVKFSLVFPNDEYVAYPDDSLKLRVEFDDNTNIDRMINLVPINDY